MLEKVVGGDGGTERPARGSAAVAAPTPVGREGGTLRPSCGIPRGLEDGMCAIRIGEAV